MGDRFWVGTMSMVNKVSVKKYTFYKWQRTELGSKKKGEADASLAKSQSNPVISLTAGTDESAVMHKINDILSKDMAKISISSTARSSSAGLPVGARADKPSKLSTVNKEQLQAIENFNHATRIAKMIKERNEKKQRRVLTSVPEFPYMAKESDDYHTVPDWVEVVPVNGEGVEQLNGGYSRALQHFRCERCGFVSGRYSMFAMVFTDDGKFAMRNASEDEALVLATRTLAAMDYDMWTPNSTQEE